MKWNQKVPPTILSYAAAVEEARAGGGSERDDDVVYIEYLNISPSKILDCASAETREWVYVVSVFIFSMEILLAEVMEPPSLFYACSQKKSEFPFYFNESKKKYIVNWGHQTSTHTHTHLFFLCIHTFLFCTFIIGLIAHIFFSFIKLTQTNIRSALRKYKKL